MKSLAAFVMRGRWQGPAVIFATSLVPLLAWLGGGVLALITLRTGPRDGAVAAGAAALMLALLVALAQGAISTVLWTLLEFWLPLWLVAAWLRWTRSLSGALLVAAVLAALGVVGLYVVTGGEPGAFWEQRLDAFQNALGLAGENAQAWEALTQQMLPLMSGLWALNLLTLVVISLFVGRWWQALLYNPGGFRAEFHSLRFDRRAAMVAVVLIVGGSIDSRGLVANLGLVVSFVFVFQALALAHWISAKRSWNLIGLFMVYMLMPFLFQVYALIGIGDVFLDVRRRLAGADSGPPER